MESRDSNVSQDSNLTVDSNLISYSNMFIRFEFTVTSQESILSFMVKSPFIQKYTASTAVGKDKNGLSLLSVALKSD